MGSRFHLKISIQDFYCPSRMKPYMYVRDHEDEWVVHLRMLPVVYDKVVIKLCNNWYKTKPIPQMIASVLLASKFIKKYLWYHNERLPYNNRLLKIVNPNAFPMVKLDKGDKLKWSTKMEIIDKEKNIGLV